MIRDEHEYMRVKRRAVEAEQTILRSERQPVADLKDYLLFELEVADVRANLARLNADLREYDERVHPDRRGDWMTTRTGARFWPLDPRPGDFDIRDIAHGLARTNRFNGRTRATYSVAQHSVLVSRLLPQRLKLFGLMHDASEAYLGDVISPVKRLIEGVYGPLEEAVMAAVADQYGFRGQLDDFRDCAAVKEADLVMLVTEARDVTTFGFIPKSLRVLPLDEPIGESWGYDRAEREFLSEFRRLDAERAFALEFGRFAP